MSQREFLDSVMNHDVILGELIPRLFWEMPQDKGLILSLLSLSWANTKVGYSPLLYDHAYNLVSGISNGEFIIYHVFSCQHEFGLCYTETNLYVWDPSRGIKNTLPFSVAQRKDVFGSECRKCHFPKIFGSEAYIYIYCCLGPWGI